MTKDERYTWLVKIERAVARLARCRHTEGEVHAMKALMLLYAQFSEARNKNKMMTGLKRLDYKKVGSVPDNRHQRL